MTTNTADKIAKLEAEIAALKAKVDPPKSTFVPISDAEHRDMVHQMQERRMSMATPPEVIRDFAVVKEIALRDARAPTGLPNSQQSDPRPSAGDGTGWTREIPLSPPPGVAQADRLMDEQDRRDRAELAQRLGVLKR
jgi:hypothetical protein